MGIYNDWYYTAYTKEGVSLEQVFNALRTAIGPEAQVFYFPRETVFETRNIPNTVGIRFGGIPSDGAEVTLIERALVTIAPLMRPDQYVAVLVGSLLSDALLYRFTGTEVEWVSAHLSPDKGHRWTPVIKETATCSDTL